LTEGYDKVKIKELLSSKGYSKKEIENAMKKAKKDVLF
jgi:SOS response regulatory protein OraA/RecX